MTGRFFQIFLLITGFSRWYGNVTERVDVHTWLCCGTIFGVSNCPIEKRAYLFSILVVSHHRQDQLSSSVKKKAPISPLLLNNRRKMLPTRHRRKQYRRLLDKHIVSTR
jgi:hypothetical protein